MLTTKHFLSVDLSIVSMNPSLRSFFVNRTDSNNRHNHFSFCSLLVCLWS